MGNLLRLRLITNSDAANVARDWFDAQKQAKAVGISGGVPGIGPAGARSATRLKTANPTSAGLRHLIFFRHLKLGGGKTIRSVVPGEIHGSIRKWPITHPLKASLSG